MGEMQQDPNWAMNRQSGEPCDTWEPLLALCAAGDELDPVQQSDLAAHLAECSACSTALDGERELLSLLRENRAEPDALLLASCRASLEDALDREEEGCWLRRKIAALLPSSWLSPRPAWSAALLVMIGFSVGLLGPRLLRRPADHLSIDRQASLAVPINPAGSPNAFARQPVIGAAPSALGRIDLHTADVAGINVLPADGDEPPQVELQMRAQDPVTVQGTVDDVNVKRVLMYVLRNNARFGPDVRLNAVDLLRERRDEPDVRSALCDAVHTDEDAGVRLKALEALDGAAPEDLLLNTMLDALREDPNPNVRVEAINSLGEMAEKGEIASGDHVLAVLRDRTEHDPNRYVRLQSAAAIRALGLNDK
jgi:hypothetical protein